MDRLDAMALVVAAIDEGSLAGAARRLGRSAAAATRAVALLEAEAGETLLLRSTRRLRPTEAGERHLAAWREVLERLAAARAGSGAPAATGTLAVTAPELFGRAVVAPVLDLFLERHGGIAARLLLLNRIVDLVAEGVDVAVRLAPLPDSSLVALRLGTVRPVVCASPDYLAWRDAPATPDALSEHACLGASGNGNRELWPFRSGTRLRSVAGATRFSTNGTGAGLDAALRGRGLVRALSYQVADAFASGRLVRVLAQFEPEPIPVHMIFRPHPKRGSPVRLFVDETVPALRDALSRTEALFTA